MLVRTAALTLNLIGLINAECGKSITSDNGKTQYLDSCDNTSYPADVTVLPGVTRLDLTNITAINNLNCQSNTDLSAIAAPHLQTVYENVTFTDVFSLSLIDLPKLQSSGTVFLQNVLNINIPSLASVQNLTLVNTTAQFLTSILSTIPTGDVEIAANNQLQQLYFPNLESVAGGLAITENAILRDMSESFPDLKEVGGAVRITGNISSLSLPVLHDVRGALLVNGSLALQPDCDVLEKLRQSGEVQGQLECATSSFWSYNPNETTPASSTPGVTTTPESTATSASSATNIQDGLSVGARLGVGVGVGVPGIVMLGALIVWLRRRANKRSQTGGTTAESSENTHWEKPEMSGDGWHRNELHENCLDPELHGNEIYEAGGQMGTPGQTQVYELPASKQPRENRAPSEHS